MPSPLPLLLPRPLLVEPAAWQDYALLDSGNGQRLERCGPCTIVRPEPQALWSPGLDEATWAGADARFTPRAGGDTGHWSRSRELPEKWPVAYKGMRMWARLTPFRHLGFFPEQAAHWDFCDDVLAQAGPAPASVLNLFGYTGVGSLYAARRGAQVTHVDASKKALDMARQNQELAGLSETTIRWICDDAVKFARREVRRGRRYDGFLLDPPKYGRGPDGERWDILSALSPLVDTCLALASEAPRFVVINAYATRLSCLCLYNLLAPFAAAHGGTIELGELVLREQARARLLPVAIFARWRR